MKKSIKKVLMTLTLAGPVLYSECQLQVRDAMVEAVAAYANAVAFDALNAVLPFDDAFAGE